MHLLVLFLFISCSLKSPFKFKYNYSKRYLASLTREDVSVHKIDGQLKDTLLFASGLDSTYLSVKLYDDQGNLMTDIDPNDLTLSTSEDVEARPFALKQGVFKTEILPRVKSKSISMRVDWQEKILSPEIVLHMTTVPLKNSLSPLIHEYHQGRIVGELSVGRGSATPESASEGFSFENIGHNQMVDTEKSRSAQRGFSFDYSEQARQNLAMLVDDSANDSVSQTMHSLFMFFPRKTLFVAEQLSGTINVTLPTGEKIIFQKSSKEITDGVFKEGPLDLTSDRSKRQFADLKYTGKGVVLRVNNRGQLPQLGQSDGVKIDMEHGLKGSGEVLILNGSTGQRCRRPKEDFWEPIDINPVEFKFSTDEEFNSYLKKNCGFKLPDLNGASR